MWRPEVTPDQVQDRLHPRHQDGGPRTRTWIQIHPSGYTWLRSPLIHWSSPLSLPPDGTSRRYPSKGLSHPWLDSLLLAPTGMTRSWVVRPPTDSVCSRPSYGYVGGRRRNHTSSVLHEVRVWRTDKDTFLAYSPYRLPRTIVLWRSGVLMFRPHISLDLSGNRPSPCSPPRVPVPTTGPGTYHGSRCLPRVPVHRRRTSWVKEDSGEPEVVDTRSGHPTEGTVGRFVTIIDHSGPEDLCVPRDGPLRRRVDPSPVVRVGLGWTTSYFAVREPCRRRCKSLGGGGGP